MDRKYIISALLYALVGLIFGSFMAATHSHAHRVTHAHIMLLGFVTTFIYAICYKLWIKNALTKVALLQFIFHQLGTLLMLLGLFLIYGQIISLEEIEPIMAFSAIAVIVAMVLMIYQFLAKNYEPQ